MNFQNIFPVERSKAYLGAAFRKAREKSNKKFEGEWQERVKKKIGVKLDVVSEELVSRLDKIVRSFPNLERLPKFYLELVRLTLDYGELKKSLGGVSWAIGKIRFFHKDYARKISRAEGKRLGGLEREFYGRISSVVKQIEEQLIFLEESRRVMRNYPDVKEMPTVVIFGFPNTGKTTLLNKLTGAKGEVAEYAFTTKGINSGFMEIGGKKIQVLDVPGTLARVEKMNNLEKIAYLTVKELAGMVVYVFDLSGAEEEEKQEELRKRLEKGEWGEKKILVYLSKRDIIGEERVKEFKEKHKGKKVFSEAEELKAEIGKGV